MENQQHVKTILEQHRDNLKNCNTFKQYRDCHVKYVQYLIERQEAKIKLIESETNFVTKSQWIENK